MPDARDEIIEQAARCLYEHDRHRKLRNPISWDAPRLEGTRAVYRARACALADAGYLVFPNEQPAQPFTSAADAFRSEQP